MSTPPRLSDVPDVVSEKHLFQLLGHLEHEQLDFKREPAKLTTIIPAMAMTDGGLIVLGVTDDRVVVGCPLDQKNRDVITRAAREVGVDIQMRAVSVDGTPIALVAVPEIQGRITTTPDGRLVRRVGGDNTPLTGDAFARFVREREDLPGEAEALSTVSPADFDLELINEALEADGRPPTDEPGVMRALLDFDLAIPQAAPADPKILAAAALVFGQRPDGLVQGASVQIVRRTGVGPGIGPVSERAELTGPIPSLLDQCLEWINRHTRRYEAVVGLRRVRLSEYPETVLREAILNALAHRDYQLRGSTVDITIWDDRIEVHSPGGLPGHITMANIRQEHYSRNRRVMRVLKTLGLVEEYGEGIDRMFDEMEARLMDPPNIEPTPSSVSVTLRNRFLVSAEDQAWLAVLGHLQLTLGERRALVAARREGSVTRRRLRQLLPDLDAPALLRGAVAKGLLVQVGQAGGARYVLSDEVVMRAGASGVEAQSRKRQMLLDEIQRAGSISTAEGAELLAEEANLVRHLLNDLVLAGLAVAKGQTRARRYYAV